LKLLPRRAGPLADALLRDQVLVAARLNGFSRPTLWVNDVTYAPLIPRTRWPSLYDVSDDWLLAPFAAREIARLRRLDELALRTADEVVVCSPGLVESRGKDRPVSLVRNAVDVEHFRRPRSRPDDLPDSPVAVYAGTAHDARIDIELVADVARALPHLTLVLVGPNALSPASLERLERLRNIVLLGPRPYADVPAYLQHADVIVVPHRVSPFMQSLDPIKAYECLAVDTPTVATPVAGFREHRGQVEVASRAEFSLRVARALSGSAPNHGRVSVPSWEERAGDFARLLLAADRDCR
jgi:teichuronic acid biosynthesis glycosyltransferase TuaH